MLRSRTLRAGQVFTDRLALIVAGVLIGAATAFVGLAVILPIVGHAAWHGYLETIDAGAFPRHDTGVTAAPRISFFTETVAFSMFEAPRLRR